MAVPSAPKRNAAKFTVGRVASGGVTMLTLDGTLDHGFEGRAIADSVGTKKLVLGMREVRRFASWGMSEWMDFLRFNADRDVYVVECSTYAATQINLVTGLLGHAKLVSFYAPYRCSSCGEEFETLIVVPRDRARMRELPADTHPCATCGGTARIEEHSAQMLVAVIERPAFDIDDEVVSFLRTNLGYDLPIDLTRFRAQRRARAPYTYLRLSGSLATLPADRLAKAAQGTTVIELGGVMVEPGQLDGWHGFVEAAKTQGSALQLLACPVGFLETALTADELRDRVKIRTFGLSYECPQCQTSTSHVIDVAENLEYLAQGTAPAVTCSSCHAVLAATMTPELVKQLRLLPARDRDPALDAFLVKARGESPDKLEDALAVATERPKAPSRRNLYLVVGAFVVVAGAAAGVAITSKHAAPVVVTNQPVEASQPAGPTFVRPDWILSDVPSSAYCRDLINRVMCVGVSSYRGTREAAVAEANDAALEEFVSTVGLKIAEPFFKEHVVTSFSPVRAKALAALQDADIDRTSPRYLAASTAVGKARRHVVEMLLASGGAAVPSRRTDWYWEEYAKKGGGTEQLVYVRYDITLDAVRALVERYSAISAFDDSSAITVFPALGWQYPDLAGGAEIVKAGKQLAEASIAPLAIVATVGGKPVTDAAELARQVHDSHAPLTLEVKSGEGFAKPVELRAHP